MAWTKDQKKLAVMACRDVGIDDDNRKLMLRQLPHAMHKGKPTSTSPRLTNVDFEVFMAIAEQTGNGYVMQYSQWFWRHKAEGATERMKRLVLNFSGQLEHVGLLEGNGAGLAGWIRARVTNDRTDKLDDLAYHEMHNLINGLRAYATRSGVKLVA